jgi:16S rRNA (cytidine1402-2'-O)-methyltransferase
VVVVAPPVEAAPAEMAEAAESLDAQLRSALATMSLRDAVAAVAGATGANRRAVYARALALGRDRPA